MDTFLAVIFCTIKKSVIKIEKSVMKEENVFSTFQFATKTGVDKNNNMKERIPLIDTYLSKWSFFNFTVP